MGDPARRAAEAADGAIAELIADAFDALAKGIDLEALTAALTPYAGPVTISKGLFSTALSFASSLASAISAALGLDKIKAYLAPVLARLTGVHDQVAQATASAPSGPAVSPAPPVTYDRVEPAVVEAIQAEQQRIVDAVTQTAARTADQVITDGLAAGQSARQIATTLRDVIALTPRMAAAVANYRAALETNDAAALARTLRDRRFDGSIRRAIVEREPLDDARIDRMVARYTERALANRALTMAQFEALRAANRGRLAAATQRAAAAGALDDLRRFWLTAADERVCPVCRGAAALNAAGIRVDEQYDMPAGGSSDGPPAHGSCRCTERFAMTGSGRSSQQRPAA